MHGRGPRRHRRLRGPDTRQRTPRRPRRSRILRWRRANRFGKVGAFGRAWRRRVDARYGKVDAHYLSLDDLIAEKAYFGRDQDLVDLKLLERARRRA
jgi:hypothetical protein